MTFSSRQNFEVTYIHTTMGMLKKGPISIFKKSFVKLGQKNLMKAFNFVSPSFFLRTKMTVYKKLKGDDLNE